MFVITVGLAVGLVFFSVGRTAFIVYRPRACRRFNVLLSFSSEIRSSWFYCVAIVVRLQSGEEESVEWSIDHVIGER